jgi:hypothetical protein
VWRRLLFEKSQYPVFAWATIFSEKMTTIKIFEDGKNISGGSRHAFLGGFRED